MIELKRQNRGKAPTKWGILLRGLAPRYRKILANNLIFKKYSNDDRFILSVFSMEDSNIKVSHLQRPFINPESKEVSTFANVINQYKIFDWNCAYCRTPIKSRIDNYKASNFTCTKCFNYYIKDTKTYNQRIVDSSVDFTTYCRKLMIENQKKFIKYIKKNEH